MRILHLISSDRWTGVAEPAASLARLQRDAGHEAWVACIWGRSLEEQLGKQALRAAHEIELPRRFNPLAIAADVGRIRNFVVANRIDVVHCHLLHDHWLAALALKGLAQNTILVRTVHRYETMRGDPFSHWLFEGRTDLVITVSTEQSNLILAAYPKLTGRLRIILGGVDPEKFKPGHAGAASVREDLGEKADAPVAGVVAHLGYNRGHNWLLEAAPAVFERVPNASLWIVGHGEIKYDLHQRVREPQFKGRLIMTGYRDTDLPDTYCAMNVAMLLALGSEGSARAALESMASGIPVVGVRKGALVDTITDGHDGFLVKENDPHELADALVKLLGYLPLARTMGKAARQTIMSRFTERHRAESTIDAYESTLRNGE